MPRSESDEGLVGVLKAINNIRVDGGGDCEERTAGSLVNLFEKTKFGQNGMPSVLIILSDAPTKPINSSITINKSLELVANLTEQHCTTIYAFSGRSSCDPIRLAREFNSLCSHEHDQFIEKFSDSIKAVDDLLDIAKRENENSYTRCHEPDPTPHGDHLGSDGRKRSGRSATRSRTTRSVHVDSSCVHLSVALTVPGSSLPPLTATGPDSSPVHPSRQDNSANIQILHFDNPAPGNWVFSHPYHPEATLLPYLERDLNIHVDYLHLEYVDPQTGDAFSSSQPLAGELWFFLIFLPFPTKISKLELVLLSLTTTFCYSLAQTLMPSNIVAGNKAFSLFSP